MKHRLVKQLMAENKKLKGRIRELEKRKPKYSNPMAALIDKPVDIEAFKDHFGRNKYAT